MSAPIVDTEIYKRKKEIKQSLIDLRSEIKLLYEDVDWYTSKDYHIKEAKRMEILIDLIEF